MAKKSPSGKPTPLRRLFSVLGPGLITGAADDLVMFGTGVAMFIL